MKGARSNKIKDKENTFGINICSIAVPNEVFTVATEDWLFEEPLDKLVTLDNLYGFQFESPGPPPLI